MKKLSILLFALFLTLFSGCALKQSASESKINPSLAPPKDIKTLSDMDSVAFEWGLVDNEAVKGFNIYRSSPDDGSDGYYKVGSTDTRYNTHYVDEKLTPNTQYYYQMASYDDNGLESPRSPIIKTKTQTFDPIPFVEAISNYPRMAKIIWRPYPNPKVEGYIVERNDLGSTDWKQVGKVKGRLNVEYIDDDLDDDKVYKYRVIAYTFNGLKSPPSKAVESVTKALPGVVQNIEATKDLPKQISLKWMPQKVDENKKKDDFSHYVIYRSSKPDGSYDQIGKTKETHYLDPTSKDGEQLYYKITAVDVDGLESPKQTYPTMGMSLPIPAMPIITSATIEGKKAVIRWKASDDRAVSYIVKRQSGSWYKKEGITFDDIKGAELIDNSIVPGIRYNYSVMSVDKNGLISEPTQEAVLLLPQGS